MMKKFLLIPALLLPFVVAVHAQPAGAPGGPGAPAAEQSDPFDLDIEDSVGAELGRTLVRNGKYRFWVQALRKQVISLSQQLGAAQTAAASAKAEADALRAENEQLRKPAAAPAPQ